MQWTGNMIKQQEAGKGKERGEKQGKSEIKGMIGPGPL